MRRLPALLAVGLLPWTVVLGPGGADVVLLYGLANPETGHFVSLPAYLFVLTSGLPDRLLAWPASALLYLVGVVAELADGRRFGARRVGDVRLTAGLFGLAALAHLAFALGIVTREGATVLPVGPALVGLVLWWGYWPEVRASVGG